jgi:RecA-family ATPase
MIEEIRLLHRKGFCLIPVNGKAAAGGWEKYNHNRPTEEMLETWFNGFFKNVAIVCGAISGITVLDIDPKDGGNVSEWLGKYPTDCYVLTGGGGAHLYYKHPGVPCENIHIAPGVQIKGDRGYVVAPPSVHPITGNHYKWLSQGEPADFPTELLELKQEKTEASGNSWISNLLEYGAEDGERNVSLTKIAGYFEGKGLPKDICINLVKTWNLKNKTKLDISEIEQTVNSVYKTAKRRNVVELVQANENHQTLNDIGSNAFRLTEFKEFMTVYGDMPIEWIVPGWLPDKTIAFIVSPPGTFKTWLTIDLALSIAMKDTKFLGMYPVRMHGPVMLIQQEDWHGQTAQRIEVIRQSKLNEVSEFSEDGESFTMDVPTGLPLFIHTDRQLKFDNKDAMSGLAKAIEQVRPKLVIIDPLYSAAETDDYMAKSTGQMFLLKELRDKYGCSFIIAHHTNKSEREDRLRAWGSQFLNAFLETGWQLFPKGKSSIKVKRHFKAAGNPSETCLSFAINTEGSFSYQVREGLVDSKNKDDDELTEGEAIEPHSGEETEKEEEMEDSPDNLSRPDDRTILAYMSQQDSWRAISTIAEDMKADKKHIERRLEGMIKKGFVRKKINPRNKPGWKNLYQLII